MPIVRIGQELERGAALAIRLSASPYRAASFGVRKPSGRSRGRVTKAAILAHDAACGGRADTAERNAAVGQPLVGVVGAQRQPVLRPRGEHPVGLGDAAGHQIVDHHAEVASVRGRTVIGPAAAGPARGVETRDQPLGRRLPRNRSCR